MKKILTLLFMFLLVLSVVTAHGEEGFAQAEAIIEQKVPCDNLSDDQLELLGDYYMEQMHPGELHEVMDERMGGEGSESLRLAHINMGLAFYCGEHQIMGPAMMNTMMGRDGYTGYGMMGTNYPTNQQGSWGMMGWFWPFGFMGGIGMIVGLLFWIAIIAVIIWLLKEYIQPKKMRRADSHLEILKKRYAKGDISKKQFEEMKKELR